MDTSTAGDSREWELVPKSEYRFELDPDTSLAIRLASGKAEIFGSEIAVGHTYLFGSECKAAVFTWHGKPSVEYISDETPMTVYSNLHLAFEQMRIRAHRSGPTYAPLIKEESGGGAQNAHEPPRLIVIGPESSGKTTVAKILTNYAVRGAREWSPILVNLDPSDGGWTVPGTLSACSVSGPILTTSPANPLGSSATSAPTALASSALLPLVHWFGHAEVKQNIPLMDKTIKILSDSISERLMSDFNSYCSGIIIDTHPSFASPSTSGAASDDKYARVRACVEAFRINAIVIVGHEKLNVEMQRLFAAQPRISILKIPKSGGVVELDHGYRERVQTLQQRTYFYGTPAYLPPSLSAASVSLGGEALVELPLSPYSSVISFDDIAIYRIGQESMAPSSALPIGSSRVISEMQPVRIDPSQPRSGLLHAILAVLSPHSSDLADEDLSEVDITGFILVQSIDVAAEKMTVLAPSPGPLSGKKAIIGTFEWQDQ